MANQPMCRYHQHARAEVFCRTHKDFLCTGCLISGEHSGCAVKELKKLLPIVIDLLSLEHRMTAILEVYDNIPETVSEQQESVTADMDHLCETIEERLVILKEASLADAKQMVENQAEVAASEKGRLLLSDIDRTLRNSIHTLLAADVDGGQAMMDADFLGHVQKRKYAQTTLKYMKERPMNVYINFNMNRRLNVLKHEEIAPMGTTKLVFGNAALPHGKVRSPFRF